MELTQASRILITGGTGFAGSHLVEELLHQGFENIWVTTTSAKPSYVSHLLLSSQVMQVDLTDLQATFDCVQQVRPDFIFHLAAIAVVGNSFEKASHIFQNNISLQLNMLEAVRQYSPETRVLVVGSGMEYGLVKNPEFKIKSSETKISEDFPLNPISPYAVSKVTQDLLGLSYHLSYGLDIIRVRPFNHIGERQTTDFAVPSFASQIVAIEKGKQQPLRVGSLDAVRDFCDVKDIVNGYITLVQSGVSGEVYNIGSGKGYTMQQVLDKMIGLSNVVITVEEDSSRIRPKDVSSAVADITKICKLGWKPQIRLEETLVRVMEEWRGKN